MLRPALLLLLLLPAALAGAERYENTFAKDFIMDAPWRVSDAQTPIPLTVVLKDCDEDDIRELHWIRCRDISAGGSIVWEHDFGDERIGDDASEANYWTWITTVTENHPGLPDGTLLTPANLGHAAGDVIELLVEIYYRDDWFNYTETRTLRVGVGGGAWPWPPGWYGGDTHYHTMYTNNIAEWGAPLPAVALSAEAMGLHWLTVTDHSCDLDETGDGLWSYATGAWEYTLQTPAGIQSFTRDAQAGGSSWSGQGADVDAFASAACRLYRGVEINFASVDPDSWQRTLHCLCYNPDYIHSPLCGAIGERPVTPDLPTGLAQLAPTGFAYAAHPLNDLGGEWGGVNWTVNGAVWGDADLAAALAQPGFRGLEIFNTRQTLYSPDASDPWDDFDAGSPYTGEDAYPGEFLTGIALWDALLAAGLGEDPPRKLFIAGGSDAHGDFNYASFLDLDDYATDNAMGKVQTVVPVPGPYAPGDLPPMTDLLAAFRDGRGSVSDGLFLAIGIDLDGDGDSDDVEDIAQGQSFEFGSDEVFSLLLRWASLPEFGPVSEVRLHLGTAAGLSSLASWTPEVSGQGYGGQTQFALADLPAGWTYVRAECLGEDGAYGRRAFTNPIWLRRGVVTAVAGMNPASAGLLPVHPNPFKPSATLRYFLPVADHVTLTVLAPNGRRLATLLSAAPRGAGEHLLQWSGRDDEGRALASGVYLLRLEAAGGVFTRKLTLLR